MNRPYIFCHMMTSIDGKIMGNYMDIPASHIASDHFYDIAFGDNPYYQHQGWLSGRVTTDDNFTHYQKPALKELHQSLPKGDYMGDFTDKKPFYISIDPSGILGWTSNELQYRTTQANIIEVISEKASDEYKAFLRELGIAYIIAGNEQLNLKLVLQKLKSLFSINTLMLGGGGVLNWSFIQAGLCDELSIVIAPAADGSSATPSLFESRDTIGMNKAISFKLLTAEVIKGDSLWIRYAVNNAKNL